MPSTTYYSIDEGADRKIHGIERTDGADTVVQPLFVEAEPALATYIVSAQGIAAATANDHLLQIMAGASLRVGIRRVLVYQALSAANDLAFAFDLRRVTTAGTGGTSVTPAPVDTADSAAGATAMTKPTSKGTESTLLGRHRGGIENTLATVGVQPVLDLSFGTERRKALWIPAGTSNGIVLKQISSDASVTFDIYAEIVETAVV